MPTLHIIFDPSDMEIRGIDADLAKKRGIRQAKISIPDGVFDDYNIEETTKELIRLMRLKEIA